MEMTIMAKNKEFKVISVKKEKRNKAKPLHSKELMDYLDQLLFILWILEVLIT